MSRDKSPNPVTEASAYQRLLMSLVGDEDPAAIQEATPGIVAGMVAEAGSGLRRRPAAGEWSVLELLGHLFDAELVIAGRYRWTLAHDQPALVGYDQDRWVERLRHNEDDPQELLTLFRTLRQANLALWKRTPLALRQRVGMHAERGPESCELMFRLMAGHDRFHIDQMRRTLAAVTAAEVAGRQSTGPGLVR